jgi:hypothetical protein
MAAAVKVSKYKQVWQKLKKEKKCEIVADPIYHKKIVKEVCRCKDLDLAYKLELSELGLKEKIAVVYKVSKVTFTLEKKLSIGDL